MEIKKRSRTVKPKVVHEIVIEKQPCHTKRALVTVITIILFIQGLLVTSMFIYFDIMKKKLDTVTMMVENNKANEMLVHCSIAKNRPVSKCMPHFK